MYLDLGKQKIKIMPSGPMTSWQIDGERTEKFRDFKLYVYVTRYYSHKAYKKIFQERKVR